MLLQNHAWQSSPRSWSAISELPTYLAYLNAHGCTSLEKVLFTFEFNRNDCIWLIFSDCFKLNLDFIDNIVVNATIAVKKEHEYLRDKIEDFHFPSLLCCLPVNGNLEKFEQQSMGSSITVVISPNKCSGSRFLVFTVCFVINHGSDYVMADVFISCQGRLIAKSGQIHKDFDNKVEFRFPAKPRCAEEMYVIFIREWFIMT